MNILAHVDCTEVGPNGYKTNLSLCKFILSAPHRKAESVVSILPHCKLLKHACSSRPNPHAVKYILVSFPSYTKIISFEGLFERHVHHRLKE